MTTEGSVTQTPGTTRSTAVARESRTRWVALGMLILQITWVFAVPPFWGADEFDHAYRAAAAARGQLFPTPTDATRGTGAWLEVPDDIVAAARPRCQDLPYTRDHDCVGTTHGDARRVSSGAGRYFPLYYVTVGIAALPFDGHAALYAMRLATVLVTWLLFCLALAATRRWAATTWPVAALVVASTPVLIFSASIVAPNGVELMASLAVWAALLGLVGTDSRHHAFLASVAAISGALLVTTRSLGPGWLLVTLIVVILATRPSLTDIKILLSRKTTWIAAGVLLIATTVSAIWILSMRALDFGETLTEPVPMSERISLVLRNEPVWILQTIAAFPNRNEATNVSVYACYLVLFVGALALGYRFGRPAVRAMVTVLMAFIVLFPALSLLDAHTDPRVWQGRYGLPAAVGTVLLVGFALDRAAPQVTLRFRLAVLGLFVAAQSVSPTDVLRRGAQHPLSDYAAFPHPPTAVIATAAALGSALLWWAGSASLTDSQRE